MRYGGDGVAKVSGIVGSWGGGARSVTPVHPSAKRQSVNITLIIFFPPDPKPHTADTSQTKAPRRRKPIQFRFSSFLQRGDEVARFGV